MMETFEQSAFSDFWTSLSDAFPFDLKRTKDKSATLNCKSEQWIETHQQLHSHWGFFFLFDLYIIDQKDESAPSARYLLVSHLIHLEDFLQLTVHTSLAQGQIAPSLFPIWPKIVTYQSEISARFNILFEKDNERISKDLSFMRKDWSGPLPSSATDPQLYQYQLNTQAQIIDFKFTTQSQTLGFEKLAEQMPLATFLPCFERINPLASSFYSLALCRLVEEAFHLKIPEREQAIRMIITELNRVLDHMSCLYQLFQELELPELAVKCLKAREIILRLFFGLSGKRSAAGLIQIGGLSFDIKMGWITECSKNVEMLSILAEQLLSATSRSWQWMNLTRIDPTTAKDALKFGVTGPALRACGVNYDLRKIEPYYFYSDLAFEVPMGINGDIYDRGLVRIEEMRESLKIIFQLIDNLPRKVSDELEGEHFLDEIFKLTAQSQLLPGIYHAGVESSNGHLGLSLKSDGSQYPSRLRVRTPSEAIKEFLQLKCLGANPENIDLILASYHISLSEMER